MMVRTSCAAVAASHLCVRTGEWIAGVKNSIRIEVIILFEESISAICGTV